MQSGLGVVYRGNDPNGIRTRVTAVKGRCPGPLDDRVTKLGKYQNCDGSAHGKLAAALSVSVRGRELAPLRALLRPGAPSRLPAHFARDAGARRCHGEAR